MHAVAIGITPAARRAVHRNADGLEKGAGGCARRPGREEWHGGEMWRGECVGRGDGRGIERRWDRDGSRGGHGGYFDPGIADGGRQGDLGAFDTLTGENAAIV